MNEHMNPNYPKQRGCFIDVNKETGRCSVVDYPTWTVKNGRWFPGANEPIADGQDYERPFATKEEAFEFCKAENYVVCSFPKSDEELAEIKAKREAYWAAHGGAEAERDAFEEALDL